MAGRPLRRARRNPTVVNLTPHPITLQTADGQQHTFPSMGRAILKSKQGELEDIGLPVPVAGRDIPEGITGLPDPQPGVFYVVSAPVGAALAGSRPDVLTLGTALEDGAIRSGGHVVAVTRLKRNPTFKTADAAEIYKIRKITGAPRNIKYPLVYSWKGGSYISEFGYDAKGFKRDFDQTVRLHGWYDEYGRSVHGNPHKPKFRVLYAAPSAFDPPCGCSQEEDQLVWEGDDISEYKGELGVRDAGCHHPMRRAQMLNKSGKYEHVLLDLIDKKWELARPWGRKPYYLVVTSSLGDHVHAPWGMKEGEDPGFDSLEAAKTAMSEFLSGTYGLSAKIMTAAQAKKKGLFKQVGR